MLRVGYDIKFRDPGNDELDCDVCSSKMDVRRNVLGCRSFASAMSRNKSVFDEFTCPNSSTDWHVQAIALMELIDDTPSYVIENMLREELRDVLYTKRPTKKLTKQW